MKRIAAFCLAFVIALGIFPTTVFAREDAYHAYLEAVEKTTASGCWSENLSMTADMEITYDTAKAKTRVSLNSQADVSGYDASDLSGLYVTGSAEMKIMGNLYTWDVIYQDGVASLHYTSPGQSMMETLEEPGIFEFGSITEDMIYNSCVSPGKITFMICGDKMDAVIMSAVRLMGVDECRYGDADVEVLLNEDTGTIDTVNMRFHGAVTFRGAHAEADYEIKYGFNGEATDSGSAEPSDSKNEPISVDDARSAWIAQHMEYASGKQYEEEIVSGYNSSMLRVFRAAADDNQIKSYQARKTISQILKLDLELKENEMYELILAELMYGNTGLSTVEEAYDRNLQITTQQTIASLAEILIESKDLPENTAKSIRQLNNALQTLQYGSVEYDSAYSELCSVIGNNIGDLKEEILGEAATTVLGIGVDGVFEMYESLADILTYINHYHAYQSTSRQITSVMEQLAEQTLVHYGEEYGNYQRGNYELADELGVWDAIINWPEFQEAVKNIMTEIEALEQKKADAVAQYAVERVNDMTQNILENAAKKASIFAAEQVMSCIPVLNTIVAAKKAAGVVVDASLILEEIFTDIKDREYAVDLLVKAYCVSVMLDETVQSCADAMSEDDLLSTMVFDASVMMYKKNQQLAVQYAIKYADMVLANSTAELKYLENANDPLQHHQTRELDEAMKRKLHDVLIWYGEMRTQLDAQKRKIDQICCHCADLLLDQSAGRVDGYTVQSPIYIMTGPVDVMVTKDNGEEIAWLSDDGDRIEVGCESYYRTVKTGNESDGYTKIAVVPEGYSIALKGSGDGTLDAYVVECSGFRKQAEAYLGIPVKEDSTGHFEAAFGGTDMVVDQVAYSGVCLRGEIPIGLLCGMIAGAGCVIVLLACFARKRRMHKAKQL